MTKMTFGQSISIFDIDTTNFPTMKAKFYAYDKDGKIQRPTKDQLKILENGIERTIIDVSCPEPKQPIAISSVLTFDVSSSMSSGQNGVINLDLAKTAAKSWINALPTKESQAAITSFNNNNYIIQDFTRDNNKLLAAIEKLQPQGGTDYNKGFIEPMGGGILMAKTGKFKRVLIFLTDGQPNSEPDVQRIINEAKINNITIFAVTLGMPCPKNLKDISISTEGFWYENVTTANDAKNVYLNIMNRIQDDPCDISWESDAQCLTERVNVKLNWSAVNSNSSYKQPTKAIVRLQVSSNFISFGKISNPTLKDTTITLTALNFDFTINDIKLKFGSTIFTIVNINFPLVIPKNTSKTITLRCASIDSSLNYASFEIETNLCPFYFSASGGYPGKKMSTQT